MPSPPHILGLFIAKLSVQNLAYSTIKNHVSAIGTLHKLFDHPDPSNSFLVQKALSGLSLSSPPPKKLLPITKELLPSLVNALPRLPFAKFDITLFKALILISYYACLRVGEAVSSAEIKHTLQLNQISFLPSAFGPTLRIKFNSFKHSSSPTVLDFPSVRDNPVCPVNALSEYLALRPHIDGNLFVKICGTPVTRSDFVSALKSCVKLIGLDPSLFNTHSLRSGRATDLALEGHSEATIKLAGRWHSSAYQQYIRVTSASFPS